MGKRSSLLSDADLAALVHGGLRVENMNLEGTPPSWTEGGWVSERWANLQAAQYLARDPSISTMTYQTPIGPDGGPFVMGSYSQNGLQQDLRNGIYQMNEGVSPNALNESTARADTYYDDAARQHTELLERQDP